MIDKEQMYQEFQKSYEQDCWTDKFTEMMMEVANGILYTPTFMRIPEKEDAYQSGLLHLLEKWKSFDVAHGSKNCFGFYTKMLYRYYSKVYERQMRHINRTNMLGELADDYIDGNDLYEDD